MLIKDFYNINKVVTGESDIDAIISLNKNHEVYDGHFPGQPVVPGVIQLQFVKEILEKCLKLKLLMNFVSQVKYLVPIIPENNARLSIKISINRSVDESLKVKAIIYSEDITFTKANLLFGVL
jgi:3-hydroxyacyl-[acyl-carrier-protein] dehydratase